MQYRIHKLMLWLVFMVIISNINAQDFRSDLELIINNNPIKSEVMVEKGASRELIYRSDPAFAFLLFIRAYQVLISSQQSSNVCVFYPSCSHFGQLSIKNYGFVKGGLMTSDRLQRCHMLSTENYRPYKKGLKLYDPIEHYQFTYPCSEYK